MILGLLILVYAMVLLLLLLPRQPGARQEEEEGGGGSGPPSACRSEYYVRTRSSIAVDCIIAHIIRQGPPLSPSQQGGNSRYKSKKKALLGMTEHLSSQLFKYTNSSSTSTFGHITHKKPDPVRSRKLR